MVAIMLRDAPPNTNSTTLGCVPTREKVLNVDLDCHANVFGDGDKLGKLSGGDQRELSITVVMVDQSSDFWSSPRPYFI